MDGRSSPSHSEDELEFHITFPAPNLETNLTFSSNLDTEEVTEPVVYILGWEGCEDDELEWLSSIYESRGFITVRYTAQNMDLQILRSVSTEPIAVRLAGLVSELCLTESPVFIHACGETGASLYQFLAKELKTSGSGSAVRGIVFDNTNICVSILTALIGPWILVYTRHWFHPSPWQSIQCESVPPALFLWDGSREWVEKAGRERQGSGGTVFFSRLDDQDGFNRRNMAEKYEKDLVEFIIHCSDQSN
ncbi:transmembrane protein 53-A [Eurytemora carolleeae]|uniref:transmembrane protein 53-A n=1 Tax=Eurytemora carolleeae TaxID=1294199 RepID=UPI000C76B8EF|nr:transmembrane protein 53-A [Eurytemora carolleeae]|eukprot:XP_023346315.1 transmembrane protein 53-A-like [Eurytemora affinis]